MSSNGIDQQRIQQLQRQIQDLEILNDSLIRMNSELEGVIKRQSQLLGKCSCARRKRDTLETLVQTKEMIPSPPSSTLSDWENESTALSHSDVPEYLDDPYLDSPFSIKVPKASVPKYCFDKHQDFEFSSSVS